MFYCYLYERMILKNSTTHHCQVIVKYLDDDYRSNIFMILQLRRTAERRKCLGRVQQAAGDCQHIKESHCLCFPFCKCHCFLTLCANAHWPFST